MLDTNIYKSKLEEKLQTLTTELKAIGINNPETDDWEATPEEAGTEADPNSSADNVEDWNERRATLSDLERDYHNVKRALAKIKNGTYGTCEISGQPIEERRLAIKPEARTCATHAAEEDQLSI